MHRTIIVRREYLHFIPKYSRYEKRHTNLAAHVSPAFRVEEGDQVTVGQCRPLSKTVSSILRTWSGINGWQRKFRLTVVDLGAIQCPARAAPYWQGCEAVPEVLSEGMENGGMVDGRVEESMARTCFSATACATGVWAEARRDAVSL